MQRTRLTLLVSRISQQLSQWLINPWRRTSLVLISLLFGYFFGITIAAVAGQAAEQDVVVSGVLVLGSETISRWVYGRRNWVDRTGVNDAAEDTSPPLPPLLMTCLNSLKIGATYALCVEAFKLGS